jgi:uncharacterized protein YndB with AHSA1/START domain
MTNFIYVQEDLSALSAQPQPWTIGFPSESGAIQQEDTREIGNESRVALLDIVLQVVIMADVRRVFHALSILEYREAWLCAPDGRGRCCVTGQTDDSYRIDFYRAGFLDVSISGSQQACRGDEIVFSWRKSDAPDTSASRVRIYLQGDSARSVLNLRHSGITSVAEHLWHQRMWGRSLEKLGWLLERSRP